MTAEPAALVVFARLPVPGVAKTRLAAGIGAEAAAQTYKLCAEAVFATACSCPDVRPQVHCSNPQEAEAVAAWLQQAALDMPVVSQLQHTDLGRRMHHALSAAAARGAAKVMIVGSDVPGLSAAVLSAAATALDTHDGVFGPSADGGYYLLGLRVDAAAASSGAAGKAGSNSLRPNANSSGQPETATQPPMGSIDGTAADAAEPEAQRVPQQLFEGIEWSTDKVYEQSVAAAQRLGLRVASRSVLPTLRDLDTRADLCAWLAAHQAEMAGKLRERASDAPQHQQACSDARYFAAVTALAEYATTALAAQDTGDSDGTRRL